MGPSFVYVGGRSEEVPAEARHRSTSGVWAFKLWQAQHYENVSWGF